MKRRAREEKRRGAGATKEGKTRQEQTGERNREGGMYDKTQHASTEDRGEEGAPREADEASVEVSEGVNLDLGPDSDPVLVWAPTRRRLLSGLLGLNVLLLGAALVAGNAFNPGGLQHQEPQVFILLLMGLSVSWMLWYLLWARRQPGVPPQMDHHAGGLTVTVVLMGFSGCSLLLDIFRIGYYVIMLDCKQTAKVISPFFEAPFLGLQTYLLWAHSKDCINKHKILTRSGLMLILCTDLLLWLNAVTEDSIHLEVELEREDLANSSLSHSAEGSKPGDNPQCKCSLDPLCLFFRKGFEVLYPFNMEYYLMAGCMLYVMWKNVGRRLPPGSHQHQTQTLTLRILQRGGVLLGPVAGVLVLLVGVTVFVLYQVWVGSPARRKDAFLLFYGYHMVVVPAMSLCSLAGVAVHQLERRAHEGGHNPTRSLDVLLLLAAALGQLSLSYLSVVAALAVGTGGALGRLDLSYSLLCLLELVLQNIFIIEGLHRHPSLGLARRKTLERISFFKNKKKNVATKMVHGPGEDSLLDKEIVVTVPPVDREGDLMKIWSKRATQEICAFLVLANIMLWVIPAFGANPQFENGLGKQFYGFKTWFILVNLGQPLGVFYRMHSVAALMELLVSA